MGAAEHSTDRAGQAQRASGTTDAQLTAQQQDVLAFERRWWRYAGAKEAAIAEQLGMNATRYYQILNQLLDMPAALAADPMLVKRLRRLRDARQRERSARHAASV